eukprot:756779-Hanusia_phi.AAC.1
MSCKCLLQGHVSMITKLLASGCKVDATDRCGRTALHHAAHLGRIRACRCLVDHAANVRGSTLYDISLIVLLTDIPEGRERS